MLTTIAENAKDRKCVSLVKSLPPLLCYQQVRLKFRLILKRILLATVILVAFFLVYIHKGEAEIIVVEVPVVATTTPPVVKTVVQQIKDIFLEDSSLFIKICKAESDCRANAVNWNCYYDGISGPCLPEDRANAWSVDCGVLQINSPGNTCPKRLFDVQVNLTIGKQMFDTRGTQPWQSSSFKWSV